jgi:hypothetical protein
VTGTAKRLDQIIDNNEYFLEPERMHRVDSSTSVHLPLHEKHAPEL